MKRFGFLLLVFILFFASGCTSIQDQSMDEIINKCTSKSATVYNTYRKGYKYNVPKGLAVIDSTEYNEVLASNKYNYYLYIDAVSYYNKVIETYEEKDNVYLSMAIAYEDKYGYLEVNVLDSGKYYVEIMYNYAKIEVIVALDDLKSAVAYSMTVLTSVYFNDNVLESLLDEEVSQFGESEFNIFKTNSDDSEYLEAVKTDVYEDEEEVHDSDLIN